VGLGSDVMRVNPSLRTVRSPYADGAELVAMPALRLDAALVHLNRCDLHGNGQALGPDPYFDDLFCLAAARAYVSCESLQPEPADALRFVTNGTMVHGVVHAPGGAWFTECLPDYPRNEAFMASYAETAKDPAAWQAFVQEHLT
jgi:glutaconate CoA-transferase subunit A